MKLNILYTGFLILNLSICLSFNLSHDTLKIKKRLKWVFQTVNAKANTDSALRSVQEFNTIGKPVKYTYFDTLGVSETEYRYYYSDTLLTLYEQYERVNSELKLVRKTVTIYDEKRRKITETSTGGDKDTSTYRYFYNSSDKLIKRTGFSTQKKFDEFQYLLTYDKKGRLISECIDPTETGNLIYPYKRFAFISAFYTLNRKGKLKKVVSNSLEGDKKTKHTLKVKYICFSNKIKTVTSYSGENIEGRQIYKYENKKKNYTRTIFEYKEGKIHETTRQVYEKEWLKEEKRMDKTGKLINREIYTYEYYGN